MKRKSTAVGLGVTVIITILAVPLIMIAFMSWDNDLLFALCVGGANALEVVDRLTTPFRRRLIEKWEENR